MPQQIKRLLILFVVLGAGLAVTRHFLVPPTFGKTGHYRESAIDSAAAQGMQYAGQQACAECHEDITARKAESHHRGVACEVCHGPSRSS